MTESASSKKGAKLATIYLQVRIKAKEMSQSSDNYLSRANASTAKEPTMSKTVTVIVAAMLLLLPTYAQSNTNAAEAAVLAWLEAIDNGEYEQAWESSSPLLKRPLSPHMLERTIGAARRDLGAVQSRRRVRVILDTSMPGAPPGDYMVFTFQTQFENRTGGVETITPHLEGDAWKVSGYYIQ